MKELSKLIPENVMFLCEELEKSGHEAWVVGGCVRDSLLGKTPKDWDITTSATYDEIVEILKDDVFVIPMQGSQEHNVCFTVYKSEQYEIATFRTDGEYKDHRHTETKPTNKIESDLSRRDFTINAMAYRPVKGEFLDLFNGQADLKNKLIRAVGNPEDRINEDALRILRAFRFANQLDFDIEPELKSVCEERFSDVNKYCSKERQRQELNSMLSSFVNKPEFYEYVFNNLGFNIDSETIDKLRTNFNPETRWAIILENSDARKILTDFNFNNGFIKRITTVIRDKDTVFNNKVDIKKYLSKESKEMYNSLRMFQMAVNPNETIEHEIHLKSLYKEIISNKEPYDLSHLKIDGNELMRLGYKGKEIGEKLNNLLGLVIKNPSYNDYHILVFMSKREPEPQLENSGLF